MKTLNIINILTILICISFLTLFPKQSYSSINTNSFSFSSFQLLQQQGEEESCARCDRCISNCYELWQYCVTPCDDDYAQCDRLCHQNGGSTVDCIRECSEQKAECSYYCDIKKRNCQRDCICESGCINEQ